MLESGRRPAPIDRSALPVIDAQGSFTVLPRRLVMTGIQTEQYGETTARVGGDFARIAEVKARGTACVG